VQAPVPEFLEVPAEKHVAQADAPDTVTKLLSEEKILSRALWSGWDFSRTSREFA